MTVTSNAGGISHGTFGVAFTLGALPSSSELTTLFDQYRISWVELDIIPEWNMAYTAFSSGNGTMGGWFHSAVDYDDNAAPTASQVGITQLAQYPSYKCLPITSHMRLAFKPRVALAAYAASAFSSYASATDQWIDCASAAVEHYGFKGVVEVSAPSSASVFANYRWVARIHVETRMVR
jgi:hypothetical protein